MTGKDFSTRIDFLLKQKNQSRKILTEELGIASSTMSSWSASKQAVPRADVVEKIADYFNVSIDWLVTGKEKDGLTHEEADFIYKLRQLPEKDKNTVTGLLEMLYKQEEIELSKNLG